MDIFRLEHKEYSITIEVYRSKRKSISLEFQANERIKARIPNVLKDKDFIQFIKDNEQVIINKYEESLSKSREFPQMSLDKIYLHGTKLPFLDDYITLIITSDIMLTPKENVKDLHKNAYVYFLEDNEKKYIRIETLITDVNFIRDCVVNRYKEIAKSVFTEKAFYYKKIMNVTFHNITVKEQKTRWGSCSSKKNLNFNWKLLMMPESILEYVVVHELAHLKYMNHSQYFWKEVEKVLPDYKNRRKWLKENGMRYQMY